MLEAFDDLTLGEIELFEKHSGVTLGEVGDRLDSKMLTALAWLIRRRDDEGFTLADAKQMRLKELYELIGEDDADPSDASGGSNNSKAALSSATSGG